MKIRPYKEKDKVKILELLNYVFRSQQHYDWVRDDNYWNWKYESNIYGKPIIYVVEHQETVIATSTLWPWEFISRGNIIKSYQPCDTAVHPDFQGKGLFNKINDIRINFLLDNEIPFVFNFPNNKSLKGNINYGWHYLTKLPWLIRPINLTGMISNSRSKTQALPLVLKKEHEINWNLCEEIVNKGVRFEGSINTYRKQGFFRWRYGNHPFFKYGQIVNEKKGRKNAAIFSINEKNNSKEMMIVDIIGDHTILPSLFDEIIKVSKSYKVSFIATVFNPHLNMGSLWKKGFVKIRNKNMVVLPLDFALEPKLVDYNNWSVIGAMHDTM